MRYELKVAFIILIVLVVCIWQASLDDEHEALWARLPVHGQCPMGWKKHEFSNGSMCLRDGCEPIVDSDGNYITYELKLRE